MNKKLLLIVAFLGIGISTSFAQNYNNWAIGLKVGEPVGLNLRKYFDGGSKNVDINFGTYGFLWGRKRDYNNKAYYDQAGLMVQGIFHWNKQLGAAERFQVYYGFGGQVNSRKTVPPVGNNIAQKQISLGAVVNGGLEFSLPDNDLSIFADLGLYAELAPKILLTAVPASVGVRLNIGR